MIDIEMNSRRVASTTKSRLIFHQIRAKNCKFSPHDILHYDVYDGLDIDLYKERLFRKIFQFSLVPFFFHSTHTRTQQLRIKQNRRILF